MPSPPEPPQHRHNHHHLSTFLNINTKALFSLFSPPKIPPLAPPQPKICISFHLPNAPLPLAQSSLSLFESTQPDSFSPSKSSSASVKGISSAESSSGFPSAVRIGRLNPNGNGGGPAFVGQVFSMCDLSGTGLMAVSTHFDVPFISKRTPEWLKKIFATVTKSERNGPMFRFFMDLGDAVAYVKRLNIPSGVVGACRLDLAYEHFKCLSCTANPNSLEVVSTDSSSSFQKEKPHLFQFVPNEKQVKAANQLLKSIPHSDGRRRVDGVPVFSAQNLDIAIATTDGIKWYTPYFFDKNMLDNILEESVDQHFHGLIQTRHMQRRRDVIDDNVAAEVIEEMGDSLLEPPEVQEVLDEMGHPAIPLSVISKAAEIQLLYAVDKVLLGNRWLRKATGIQPKFPYLVDSFERRSAFSLRRASESTSCLANSKIDDSTSEHKFKDNAQTDHERRKDLRLPFGDWFSHPWLKKQSKSERESDTRKEGLSKDCLKRKSESNPFLPKVTMVGVSTGDAGQLSKSSLKKTMEDLTKELEQTDEANDSFISNSSSEFIINDRDPLFVANVGDYYSGMAKTGTSRCVRG